MVNKNRILLIFPKLGSYDRIVKDLPLSLIYAARMVQREGFDVALIDQRLQKDRQKERRQSWISASKGSGHVGQHMDNENDSSDGYHSKGDCHRDLER